MNKKKTQPEDGTVFTIPKERAVFWMDEGGRWHNCHGPFEHKKLIAYFNASIRKDEDGYFVTQTNGALVEKVYFRYEVTALFVVDIEWQPAVNLVLNTGTVLPLIPEQIYLHDDQLYMAHDGEVIKFAQEALLKLSQKMDFDAQGVCWLTLGQERHPLSKR